MALALSNVKRKSGGNLLIVNAKITLSGSYSTGGEALDFGTIAGLTNRQPDIVLATGKAGHIYQYDHANKKLLVLCNTAGGANGVLAEHSAAAYEVTASGDDVRVVAIWLTIPTLPTA